MSVDYDGVGGIGLRLTEVVIGKLVKHGLFTKAEFEDDKYNCLEKIGLPFSAYGNAFSGDTGYVLLVDGSKFSDIYENAPAFIERLAEIGIVMEADDLEVINEIYVS